MKSTALGASEDAPPRPLTYRIAAPAHASPTGSEEAEAGLKPVDALLRAERKARAEREARRRPNVVRELLVVVLLSALGVMTAYYWAPKQGMDPTLYMAACGTLGLLFGWICIRWMRPRR